MYHFNGVENGFADTVESWYESYVFPKMNTSYQYGLYVPGSFASAYNTVCNETCYDQFCAIDATNFYNLAKNDSRIIGLAVWHWLYMPNCIPAHDEIGTKYLNISKQTWKQIGKEIIANNLPK